MIGEIVQSSNQPDVDGVWALAPSLDVFGPFPMAGMEIPDKWISEAGKRDCVGVGLHLRSATKPSAAGSDSPV